MLMSVVRRKPPGGVVLGRIQACALRRLSLKLLQALDLEIVCKQYCSIITMYSQVGMRLANARFACRCCGGWRRLHVTCVLIQTHDSTNFTADTVDARDAACLGAETLAV